MATNKPAKAPRAAAAAIDASTKPTVTTFAEDYWQNAQILYPAGVPVPTTEHTQQLLDDGIAGEIHEVAGQ